MHNYYRSLHDAPPLKCDPELAKSAQSWADEEARQGKSFHSPPTEEYTESIMGWGFDFTLDKAILDSVRSYYSEIKNNYNYETGEGSGVVGHFMAVVWKSQKNLGCGYNNKPGVGTYVVAHYTPPSHANVNYKELAPKNVLRRKDPGQ